MANKKKLISTGSAGAFILILLGILILVNLISVQFFGRIDLTENSEFSLAEVSKDTMRALDDQILAKAYFSKDLPAPYNTHARFLKDLFEEYKAYSSGKFSFEFIDPGDEEETRMELTMNGIPPVQIQVLEDDEFKVKQVAMGIVFYYADKKEVIPVVKSTRGLEYEITSMLRKLVSDKLKVIGFLQGHGEPSLKEKMKEASKLLEKNYKTIAVQLGQDDKIAEDIDALVIVSPTQRLSEQALYEIDQFIMKGKSVAFLLERYNVDLQRFNAMPVTTGLEELLKHYGVTINGDFVLDVQNKRINVSTQQGNMQIRNIVNYPFIPVITQFKEESTLVGSLEALSFPFVSSLELAANSAKVTYEVLAQSSPRSWSVPYSTPLSPLQRQAPTETSKVGPFPVMATVTGILSSRYAGMEASREGMEWLEAAQVIPESSEAHLLVVGDGTFPQDDFLDAPNLIFFANMIDWMVQDGSMSEIRGRGVTERPLAQLENWEKNTIKYVNLFGIPILLILYGFLRWGMRKARKSGLQLSK